MEMVERLLLDRIDAESRRSPVGREDHRVVLALAHEARATLALVQLAFARAEVALDAPVGEPLPPASGKLFGHLITLRASRFAAIRARERPIALMAARFPLRTCAPRTSQCARPVPSSYRAIPPCASAPSGNRADAAAGPIPAAGMSRGGDRIRAPRRRRRDAGARARSLR